MGVEQPDDQRWKSKYRALLDEQAANDEHTDSLRQTVIRLSYLFAGQSEDLDDLLEELRLKVRRGAETSDLQSLLELISDSLEAQDHTSAVIPSFNDEAEAAPIAEPPVVGTQVSDVRPAEPAFKSISDRIEAVLIDMVANLKVPESVAESKARIEETLRSGLNWYELIATLEELSLLVAGTLYEGEKDYSGFLQSTISGLAELQALIKSCQDNTEESKEQGRLLEQSIGASLQLMSESLQSDDIEKMKRAVQLGLSDISGNVQSYNEKQESHSLELRENVHALSTQVLQLQQEVANAHKQVEAHKQKAATDPLTKLPNRAAYDDRLALEYARWVRYQRPLSVAVGDVDYFKKVNDTHGHLAGDDVLKRIADLISETIRKTDFSARFGGEEFVFILPETEQENALLALEKLREAISALSFSSEQGEFSVSMSFGITCYRDSDNVNMAFSRADQALYAAKQQGRNQCVVAPLK